MVHIYNAVLGSLQKEEKPVKCYNITETQGQRTNDVWSHSHKVS